MRTEIDTLRAFYRYNTKQRRAYLETIWRLPEAERYKDRRASFPSLVDIFLHVLDAHKLWFRKVYRAESDVPEYPLGIHLSLAEVRREETELERMLGGILRNLTPRKLDQRYRFPGEPQRVSLREMLLHMIEEELQHRGEMNALLWQIDVDPPTRGM